MLRNFHHPITIMIEISNLRREKGGDERFLADLITIFITILRTVTGHKKAGKTLSGNDLADLF